MKRLIQLQSRQAAIAKSMRALTDAAEKETRELNAEEVAKFEEFKKQLDAVKKDIEIENTIADAEKSAVVVPDANVATAREAEQHADKPKATVPANARKYGSLKAFKGKDADERAYKSGMFLRATLFRDSEAARWCKDAGMDISAAMSSTDNAKGGFLIPDEMLSGIIDLREQYGVFRQNCQIWPMGSDTLTINRRSGGLTAYFVGESTAPTDSEPTWNQVQLTARKVATLTRMPKELAEDAVINLADLVAREIAYAFALKEDQCGFLGDGTSTYGGITGVVSKINDGSHAGAISTAASGHTGFETLTLSDFHALVAKLPLYARMNAKWYVSTAGHSSSMDRLMYAAGGNTVQTIGGGSGPSFLGYPVVFSQVLNSTLGADTSAIKLLFGDLSLAASFGDRRAATIEADGSRYFELDQIAIKGTQRFDVVVHDVGDASTAGQVVALKTPAS